MNCNSAVLIIAGPTVTRTIIGVSKIDFLLINLESFERNYTFHHQEKRR